MNTSRFLGIDYGVKRIGIAISDENAVFAFPKAIILNDKDKFKKVGAIIKSENVRDIVVGESVDFSGAENVLSKAIEVFISELKKKFKVKIHKQKEFLTTVEARKMGNTKMTFHKSGSHSKMKDKRGDKVDASAAALILQRYLDKINQATRR